MRTEIINFKKETLGLYLPAGKRYYVADTKTPGLRLAVYPTGVKTFILYRKVKGRPQRIKIGRYPEISVENARREANRLSSLITLGGDPHEEKLAERREMTFAELYELYYTHHAVKFTKRPQDNKRSMEFHILPAIGTYRIHSITREKIRTLHTMIGEKRGKGTANRVFAIVSSVFNFGIKNDYYERNNPCFGLKKYPSRSRDRFLSKEELQSFFDALKQEDELFQHFFLMALYTGARKGNVLSMRWSDVDLRLKRWRIPESETKNGDVNIVVLSEPTIAILERRKKENDDLPFPSPFVFPGEGVKGHLDDPKRSFCRVKQRMEIDDFRIHDLRRTLGSYMAISGASMPVIGKALNHKSQVSTAIYARLSQAPVLDAVNIAATLMMPGHMP